jgi:hypothetical protein
MQEETREERSERLWVEDFEKLREIRGSGKLWAARDFGLAMMKRRGYREELSREIAEIFYAMKDYPRAGLYWLTTREDSPEALECIDWCIRAYGRDLPKRFRKPLHVAEYPEEIAERIDRAIRDAGVEEGIGELRIRGQKAWSAKQRALWTMFSCSIGLLFLFFLISGIYFVVWLIFA